MLADISIETVFGIEDEKYWWAWAIVEEYNLRDNLKVSLRSSSKSAFWMEVSAHNVYVSLYIINLNLQAVCGFLFMYKIS